MLRRPWLDLTEAAASPAKRRRAQTSPAPTSTTMSLYVQHALDRGNKRQEWRSTKAWPCAAAGSGRGNLTPAKSPNTTPLPLPGIHLPTTSNKVEALFEPLLQPTKLATVTASNPVHRRQRKHSRFTPAAVKAFPVTCCSIDETAARARQTSQGDAKALLN